MSCRRVSLRSTHPTRNRHARHQRARCCSPSLAAHCAPRAAHAQDAQVADFYKGKQVNIFIGSSAGGGYDTYARLLGRHLGKHIPGNPVIVPSNMPGAASNISAAYVYNVAPKDGTAIGTVQTAAVLDPLFADKARLAATPPSSSISAAPTSTTTSASFAATPP